MTDLSKFKEVDFSNFEEVDFSNAESPPDMGGFTEMEFTPYDFEYRNQISNEGKDFVKKGFGADVDKSLQGELSVDPLAVLEPFGIDVMDPIETGVSLETADKALSYMNPMTAIIRTLGFTPEYTSKEINATLAGWGHGMLDTSRGIKQLLDIDVEEEKTNEAIMNDLYSNEEYKVSAKIGEVGGIISEPIGFLLPGAKARTVKKAIVVGAGTGAVFGFTGYVDEEKGESRAVNTGIGAVTGSIFSGLLTYGVNKTMGFIGKGKIEAANRSLREFEEEYARLILEGNDIAGANRIIKQTRPDLMNGVKKATDLLQVKPDLPTTEKAAKEVLSYYDGLHKTHKSGSAIDKTIGVIHTRVKNISEEVANSLSKLEFNIHTRPMKYIEKADGFRNIYKTLNNDSKHTISKAILNSDFAEARKELRRVAGKEAVDSFDKTTSIFSELGTELEKMGVIEKQIDNYWHRSVKDVKGLLRAIGSTKGEIKNLSVQLAEKNKEVIKSRGYPMTPYEEGVFVQGKLTGDKQFEMIGYANRRGIRKVPDHLVQYYADPIESLESYIHNSIWDIEQANFLGPGNFKISKDKLFDPDYSINSWAKNLESIKDLSPGEFRELKGIIKARLGVGQVPMSSILKGFKVFTYSALLGNPIAAATQFGDLANAAYRNGLVRSIKTAVKVMSNNTDIKVKDLGLVENLVQEFSDVSKGDKALNFFMKYGGFQAVDRLGKSTLVNGALDKFARASMRPKSRAYGELVSRYRKGWGKEFHNLVRDLQVYEVSRDPKDITDNIRFLVWEELSAVQPISLSEVPEHYLTMPNGKIFYMLKTFMLKQLDLLRVDGIQQIQKGNTAAGVSNIAKYLMLMGGANLGVDTLKDMALGRESKIKDIEDIPGEYVSNMFKTFGITEYLRTQAAKDGPLSAAASIMIPPVNVLDDIFYKSWGLADPHPEKAVKHVPIVGRIIAESMGDK